MTRYLKEYIEYIKKRLYECTGPKELEEILSEHKDKIAFMQHERLVHFLVTMMFAIILVIFIAVFLTVDNIMLGLLIVIITALLAAYIKHYYFLENTVQSMYRIYDDILKKRKQFAEHSSSDKERISDIKK